MEPANATETGIHLVNTVAGPDWLFALVNNLRGFLDSGQNPLREQNDKGSVLNDLYIVRYTLNKGRAG